MDQEIHPCGQGRIDSVEINPSLLRMRECPIKLKRFKHNNDEDVHGITTENFYRLLHYTGSKTILHLLAVTPQRSNCVAVAFKKFIFGQYFFSIWQIHETQATIFGQYLAST